MVRRVNSCLGTMEMGRNKCVEAVPSQMIKAYMAKKDIGDIELDTAFMYCGGNTEKVLGNIPAWKGKVGMATKVNPWNGKGLGRESVLNQFNTSLTNMKVDKVKILYLHAPDHDVPLIETLTACNDLHKEGKFDELGISNFSSWLTAEAINICKNEKFVIPTVYQGMYSAITRQVEHELIPCLRYYGLRFYAYSPLGGGILTGKYKFEQDENHTIESGRFNMSKKDCGGFDKIYRDRYWKAEHFNAINKMNDLLKEHHPDESISMAEAAYRWALHHSILDGEKGDRLIIGASRLEQLETNMSYLTKGPLAEPVVSFFDDWWKSTAHLCPSYLR